MYILSGNSQEKSGNYILSGEYLKVYFNYNYDLSGESVSGSCNLEVYNKTDTIYESKVTSDGTDKLSQSIQDAVNAFTKIVDKVPSEELADLSDFSDLKIDFTKPEEPKVDEASNDEASNNGESDEETEDN